MWETEQAFLERYGDTEAHSGIVNLQQMKLYGCNLEFGVDATAINLKDEEGNPKKFDCIIFNFPYPHTFVRNNHLQMQIKLIDDFLKSAAANLLDDGEVRVSLIRGQYNRWNVDYCAAKWGLKKESSIPFKKSDFSFYRNRYGDQREHTRKEKKADYIDTGDPHYHIFRKNTYLLKKAQALQKEKQIEDAQIKK